MEQGIAAERRAAAIRNVASVDTDYHQRPQELGPKPGRIDFAPGDASLTQSQYGARCALCNDIGKLCPVFDPSADEAARKIWLSDHDPQYLRQQRNAILLCSTHERAYRSYHIVFAPSEATLRDYIQSELRDYEARRKAAKMLQVQEPNYSLETKGTWAEVMILHNDTLPPARPPNPVLKSGYHEGNRLIFLPNITGAVCYFQFLTAVMSNRHKQLPTHHSPRTQEMIDLLLHYSALRARPDPIPKLKLEQQAVMTEQRTVSTPKDLGPQVSKPTLSASVGASNVGNGFSAKTNGLSRLFKPAPLNNISSIERPKTALGERQRRTSSELGSKLDNLSLGTPPRPGTAVPSHRRHGSFQLPTFKTSKTGPSPPTTPSAPSGPTSPFSSFQRGAQSPSPQKTSQTFDGRTRRSSFTGGHANYAAGTNLPSSIQRSLSPLSPQSPQRSLSPLSFSSGSPTSSFSSGSPPLSRVASPDTSPGFASMHVGGRNRTPSFGEMFCNPARSQSFSATPLSFSGRARSGSGSATTSPTKPGYFRVNRNTR